MMKRFFLACMLYMQLAFVSAAPLSDADFCRNGLFPREQDQLVVGVIQGQKAERIHFFDDLDGCPSKGVQCMRSSYLVPGDQVIVGKTTAEWACVWYQGRKHESVSWVPKKNVAALPPSAIDPSKDWVGLWVDGPDKIRISMPKPQGRLQMASDLRWEGGTLPNGELIENLGGIGAALEVHGSTASAASGDCQVMLTRVGKYLVADDNGACGGMNVRHTGMYLRPPRQGS
jgi:hypothetical protein